MVHVMMTLQGCDERQLGKNYWGIISRLWSYCTYKRALQLSRSSTCICHWISSTHFGIDLKRTIDPLGLPGPATKLQCQICPAITAMLNIGHRLAVLRLHAVSKHVSGFLGNVIYASATLHRPMLGVQEGSFQGHGGSITAGEFDRLSFLMHSASDSPNPLADGSPMDTSPTPFSGEFSFFPCQAKWNEMKSWCCPLSLRVSPGWWCVI